MKASNFTRFHPRSRRRPALLALLSALLLAPVAHACPPGSADVGACETGPHCCRPCAAGHYSANGLSCLPCGPGTVQPQPHSASCSACRVPMVPNPQHTACVLAILPHATTPGLLESSPALPRQGPGSAGTPLGGGPAGGARGPAGAR